MDLQIGRSPQESIINKAAGAPLTSGRTAKSRLIGWLTYGGEARRKNGSSQEVLELSHLTQAAVDEIMFPDGSTTRMSIQVVF